MQSQNSMNLKHSRPPVLTALAVILFNVFLYNSFPINHDYWIAEFLRIVFFSFAFVLVSVVLFVIKCSGKYYLITAIIGIIISYFSFNSYSYNRPHNVLGRMIYYYNFENVSYRDQNMGCDDEMKFEKSIAARYKLLQEKHPLKSYAVDYSDLNGKLIQSFVIYTTAEGMPVSTGSLLVKKINISTWEFSDIIGNDTCTFYYCKDGFSHDTSGFVNASRVFDYCKTHQNYCSIHIVEIDEYYLDAQPYERLWAYRIYEFIIRNFKS